MLSKRYDVRDVTTEDCKPHTFVMAKYAIKLNGSSDYCEENTETIILDPYWYV